MSELAKILEALLFLSNEPVSLEDLAAATDAWPDEVAEAMNELQAAYAPGERGLIIKEVAGGFTLATDPASEAAA